MKGCVHNVDCFSRQQRFMAGDTGGSILFLSASVFGIKADSVGVGGQILCFISTGFFLSFWPGKIDNTCLFLQVGSTNVWKRRQKLRHHSSCCSCSKGCSVIPAGVHIV